MGYPFAGIHLFSNIEAWKMLKWHVAINVGWVLTYLLMFD